MVAADQGGQENDDENGTKNLKRQHEKSLVPDLLSAAGKRAA